MNSKRLWACLIIVGFVVPVCGAGPDVDFEGELLKVTFKDLLKSDLAGQIQMARNVPDSLLPNRGASISKQRIEFKDPIGLTELAQPIALNAGLSFHEINRNIRKLAPYVLTVQEDNVRLQTFDAKSALDNGFPKDVVFLVQEIIQFQNGMMVALASGKKNVMAESLDAAKYPRLSAFFKMKPQVKDPKIKDERVEPCGDYSNPIPDRRPDGWEAYSFDPAQTLFDMGFHRTAGYACGDYVEVDCDHDFTSGTWNNGPYGYCESPRFRMHGATDGKRPTWYFVHGAEPNPELHSYVWPYYNWGNYVYWWHQTY